MSERKMSDITERSVPIRSSNALPERTPFLSQERRQERRGNVNHDVGESTSISGTFSPRRKSRAPWSLILIIVLVILVAGVAFATWRSKAIVTLTPLQETATLDETFRVYREPQTPGNPRVEIVEYSASESLAVPASGTKHVERKATGRITVYNNYGKESITFKPNTRFQTGDGKIYRAFTTVKIPGQRTVGGKTEPGTVEISVTADQPGAEYNIGPSSFTVPGLSGTDQFDKISARSSVAMEGGVSGEVKVVSDAEIARAKSVLEGKLTEKLLADVREKLPEGKVFFADAYSATYEFNEYGTSSTTPIGGDAAEAANTQNVSMSGHVVAAVFDKQELADYLAKRKLTSAGEASLSIHNWDELSLELGQYDDLASLEDMTVRISGAAQFVWQIDQASIKTELAGKPKSDYSKVFLGHTSIYRAEVRISPFWIKHFPKDTARIIIVEKIGDAS